MTIDEAIEVFKHPTQHFSSEHREADKIAIQSMEELKEYKQKPDGWMWDEAEQRGYNKGIDDFAEKLNAKCD